MLVFDLSFLPAHLVSPLYPGLGSEHSRLRLMMAWAHRRVHAVLYPGYHAYINGTCSLILSKSALMIADGTNRLCFLASKSSLF